MNAPLISVIMPVHDAAPFVCEAVESVLAQTLGDFELITIDDASSDGSGEILASFTDPRCRVLRNVNNLGAAETKNRGIAEARGEFLAFLDADDVATPQRLARQLEWLRAHPAVGVLGSSIEHIDTEGKSLGTSDLAELESSALRARLLFHNRIAQSSVMLRAAVLEELRFRKEFEPAEDYDLWTRMKCELAVLDETLVHYRIHDRSVSAKKGEAMLRAVRAIHASQLGKLGLSDEEGLHAATAAFDPISSFDLFKRIERWLCTLKQANRDCGTHPPGNFDRELQDRWFATAGRAYQLGLPGWRFWRQSQVHTPAFAADFRLLARALRGELPRRRVRPARASEASSRPQADVNILLVNNQWRLGGAETVVHQLRRAFPSSRLAVADGKTFPADAEPLYPRVLARLSHSRLHSMVEHLAPRAGWTDRAFRRLHLVPCDLIHLHNFHGRYATIDSLAHLARHKPLVWTFHALWGVTGGCDHPRECRRFLSACGECPQLGRWPLSTHDDTAEQLSTKNAQLAPLPLHVVAPSRWLAEMVRASLVGRHWRVHHIPNAVDAKFCKALDGIPGKHQDTPAILIVNRNFRDEQKGFPILETALATAAAAQPNPRPRLILVGENSDWARQTLVGWSCESHGYVSDIANLARLHRSAGIFLFASPAENFPCVVLEAMAAGSCIVATPTGGLVEQIEDGVSGLLAANISGPALGAALVRALADSALRRRLGDAARDRAQRDFDEALFLERHRQLYAEVIDAWQAPS